jgi:hypothetical protein
MGAFSWQSGPACTWNTSIGISTSDRRSMEKVCTTIATTIVRGAAVEHHLRA